MRPFLYTVALSLIVFTCHQNRKCIEKDNRYETSINPVCFSGIKGNVADAETGEPLSARIVIYDESGEIANSYYKHLSGFFTNEDGSFEHILEPGKYSISIYHGIDFESQEIQIEVSPEQGFKTDIFLKPWYPLRNEGWVTGGGHCHLYTEHDQDNEMLEKVRKICLAQGVDFVCAAQGWAGYKDSTWQEGYACYNDDRFIIHYGSEMPKYRTGHTWWIGQTSTRDYFWNTMDETYEQKYFHSETGTEWSYDDIDFPYIPNIEVVQRFKKADNAVAIMAHPTSWWWQKRGDIRKYTTNVSSYLTFGLLAGKIWDGFVVMGYNHDHYQYQNIWFHILNLGYRMPAISELDGGFEKNDRFYYGSMRTYFHVNGEFSIPNIADAVRRGETFVTSGPIIKVNIDEKYRIGDIIRIDKNKHSLNIEVFASGDKEDYLSYIIVYRKGEIYKLWDIREEKLRTFKGSLEFTEKEQAWYVVKAYGRKAWENPEHLDVLKVCDKSLKIEPPPYNGNIHDVCITSPFYFWPKGQNDPEAMSSEVNLTLLSPGGENIKNASIDILVNGSLYNKISLIDGTARFIMPVHGLLKISIADNNSIFRGLFLDYKPHLKLLEKLVSGKWMDDHAADISYTAGEVPWEAFQFKETKEILTKVNWEIEFIQNERDTLWQEFEDRFKKTN
ncbi:MAG: CehA/McbA family metallohydrolase [Bacteroidales bacterium]|nr:CehA/McbA family metallohydrolase [Bacteroidales bacterium]